MSEQVVYGRIINIQTIRIKGLDKDSVIILSQRQQFAIWQWNNDKCCLAVQFAGSILGKVEKPLESGSLMSVDPYGRCIAILAYQGVVHIISTLDSYTDQSEKSEKSEYKNPFKKIKSSTEESHLSQKNSSDISYTIPKVNWNHGKGKEVSNNICLSNIIMCRIEELKVIDIKFLNNPQSLVLAVLYEDAGMLRHIKTYRVKINKPYSQSKKVKISLEMNWSFRDVGYNCNLIAPRLSGGLLAVGEDKCALIDHSGAIEKMSKKQFSSLKLKSFLINDVEWIDEKCYSDFKFSLDNQQVAQSASNINLNFSNNPNFEKNELNGLSSEPNSERLLLGDDNGVLWLLVIFKKQNGAIADCSVERLGTIPVPQTLSYIGDGILYIGSHYGDSRLVELRQTIDSLNCDIWDELSFKNNKQSFLQHLQNFNNLAPISDMCILRDSSNFSSSFLNGEKRDTTTRGKYLKSPLDTFEINDGGERLITCSGSRSKASLRVVRSALGIKVRGIINLNSVCGLWTVAISDHNTSHNNNFSIFMILAFPTCTTLLEFCTTNKSSQHKIELNQPLDQFLNSSGWTLDEPTIYTSNAGSLDLVLQVTRTRINLLRYSTCKIEDFWQPSDNIGHSSSTTIMFASSFKNHLVVYLKSGYLVYFNISNSKAGSEKIEIVQESQIKLDLKISSLVVRDPFSIVYKNGINDANISPIVAVACWGNPNLQIFSLPNFKNLLQTNINVNGNQDFESSHAEKDLSDVSPFFINKDKIKSNNQISSIDSSNKFLNAIEKDKNKILSENSMLKHSYFSPSSLIRSIEFVRFDNQSFILLGFSNGQVLYYNIAKTNSLVSGDKVYQINISAEKKMSFGTYPVNLKTYQVEMKPFIFIATDKPAVMHSNGSKPLFSYVKSESVLHFCSAIPEILQDNAHIVKIFGNTMCFINQDSLKLITIEKIQKMHIDTVPLSPWESPYKLAHYAKTRSVILCSIELLPQATHSDLNSLYPPSNLLLEKGWITVMDDLSFEVLTKIGLPNYELPECVSVLTLQMIASINVFPSDAQSFGPCSTSQISINGTSTPNNSNVSSIDVVAVGTAITLPDDDDASSGNIYIYQYDRSKKKLVELQKIPTKGAVYSIVSFKGMLAAAINNNVVLYAWKKPTSFSEKIKAGSFTPTFNNTCSENYPLNLQILSVESTHVVSLHLATTNNLSYEQKFENQNAISHENSSDFLAVGDLMTGVSILQHKNIPLKLNTKLKNNEVKNISEALPEDTISSDNHSNDKNSMNPQSINGPGALNSDNSPEILIQHRLEEVSREYFSSWTTALSCSRKSISNTAKKQKSSVFEYMIDSDKKVEHEKIGLQILAAENGLNIYSLYYGEDILKESQLNEVSSSSRNALGKVTHSVQAKQQMIETENFEEKKLQLTGRYHIGDLINTVIPGTLVMSNFKTESVYFRPELLFGTLSGALYASINVSDGKVGKILDRLQTNMAVLGPTSFCGYTLYSRKYKNLGDFYFGFSESFSKNMDSNYYTQRFLNSAMFSWSHTKFRTYSTLQKTSRQFGFIDGDLIINFLEYPSDLQRFIFNGGTQATEKGLNLSAADQHNNSINEHVGNYNNQLFVTNAFEVPEERLSKFGISAVSNIGISENISFEYLIQCLESLSTVV
ncbi:hypothetical protein BB561_005224 [Smittium simulii]|uniref:Cleavage/polyadenylation specificity factor A subunit C-terminal domain-containing protein n=1 Tax=Smittium simulii TaxID=133385 RepID=A0A2T9YBI3_9FUNG|nr:hypothetical protein BB561_005224 [Smittium simulii]